MPDLMMSKTQYLLLGLAVMVVTQGCTSSRRSDTARTGMEQMLISNAVDQSLDKFDFASMRNRTVFIDQKYLDCVDKGYLVASTRERVLHHGGRLTDKADTADVVVELRSGAIGTDNLETYVGTPNLSIPGMAIELPEIKFWNRTSQVGTAKIGIMAYDPKSGALYTEGGQALARSDDNNWFVFGVGPFQDGSVRNEVEQAQTAGSAFSSFPPFNSPIYIGSRPEDTDQSRYQPRQPNASPSPIAQTPAPTTPDVQPTSFGRPNGQLPPVLDSRSPGQMAQPAGYYPRN